MIKKDLLTLIANATEEQDVDEMLKDCELVKKFSGLDTFKTKLESDKDFKSYFDSERDKHSTKYLETWKSNNLQKLIDDEIKKRFPEKDEKEIEIEKWKSRAEQLEKEYKKKDLTAKALKIAQEKNLPSDLDLIGFFVTDDEKTTDENIKKFETIFNKHLETIIKTKFGENYKPPMDNIQTNIVNPFKKETFNLTEQAKILKENPQLAEQLKAEASK